MATFETIAIIYNPNSTGKAKPLAEQLAGCLRPSLKSGQLKLVATEYAGHAEELAYELAKKHGSPLLISASGDGGYNEVINGAMRAQQEGARPACAVLPAGNANDHFHDTNRSSLKDSVLQAETINIDLLEVLVERAGATSIHRYAHSYVGLGLTPTVAIELNRHSLNAFRELYIVLRSFFRFRPFQIEVEDKTLTLDSLIISHIGRMAKVFNFERSDLDDGVFEITILPHGHKLRFLAKLLKAAVRGLKPDGRAAEYNFTTKTAMPMQLDGEVIELRAGDQVTVKNARQMLKTLL